jgi:hypothetical protein
MINKLDVIPSNLPGNSHCKQKARKQNNDVAHRTRSKTGHLQQNVGNRTRFKFRSYVERKLISIKNVASEHQLADILTKPLAQKPFI